MHLYVHHHRVVSWVAVLHGGGGQAKVVVAGGGYSILLSTWVAGFCFALEKTLYSVTISA